MGGTAVGDSNAAGATLPALAAERHGAELVRFLETMPAAFCFLDTDWRFRYVNAEAERLMGRAGADIVGESLWEAFPDLSGSADRGDLPGGRGHRPPDDLRDGAPRRSREVGRGARLARPGRPGGLLPRRHRPARRRGGRPARRRPRRPASAGSAPSSPASWTPSRPWAGWPSWSCPR